MMRLALIAAVMLLAGPARAQAWLAAQTYTVPGSNTGWGNMVFDSGSGRLFVARRGDGLLAWDVKAHKGVTVDNSHGATAVVLVPETGRGFASMEDGTALNFDLGTLKAVSRTDLGVGDLQDVFYEPTQKRVYMLTGARPEKTTWVGLDAATGEVIGQTRFNSKQMGTPTADGEGGIFAPQRDRNLLQKLHARDLSLQKTWKLGDCAQPVDVRWEPGAKRVLLACRGDKPVFVALDQEAGVVATVPIGRGVGGIAVDKARHLIVTANGLDGTMSVIRQQGPSEFALVETIATRPMARDLAIDEATQRLYSVAASYTQPAAPADGPAPPPYFHPDSFTILTYRPN